MNLCTTVGTLLDRALAKDDAEGLDAQSPRLQTDDERITKDDDTPVEPRQETHSQTTVYVPEGSWLLYTYHASHMFQIQGWCMTSANMKTALCDLWHWRMSPPNNRLWSAHQAQRVPTPTSWRRVGHHSPILPGSSPLPANCSLSWVLRKYLRYLLFPMTGRKQLRSATTLLLRLFCPQQRMLSKHLLTLSLQRRYDDGVHMIFVRMSVLQVSLYDDLLGARLPLAGQRSLTQPPASSPAAAVLAGQASMQQVVEGACVIRIHVNHQSYTTALRPISPSDIRQAMSVHSSSMSKGARRAFASHLDACWTQYFDLHGHLVPNAPAFSRCGDSVPVGIDNLITHRIHGSTPAAVLACVNQVGSIPGGAWLFNIYFPTPGGVREHEKRLAVMMRQGLHDPGLWCFCFITHKDQHHPQATSVTPTALRCGVSSG